MNYETSLTVELTTRPEPIELTLSLEYGWCNDGIGSYEYWGSTGYDHGTDYVEIENYSYDKDGFTDAEIAEIELTIDKSFGSLTAEIEKQKPLKNEDYDEYDPYDIEYDR